MSNADDDCITRRLEDGTYKFYYEKREGDAWPLTEEHITLSVFAELSDEEWTEFLNLIGDGAIKPMGDSSETGDSGPWAYLKSECDGDEYQALYFAVYDGEKAFADFCGESY